MLDALKIFMKQSHYRFNLFNHYIFSVSNVISKGFVLSLLAASKWLLAYVVTLILFPRIKPYFKNIIDSEYVLMYTWLLFLF